MLYKTCYLYRESQSNVQGDCCLLTPSNTGGGGGRKVVALILIVENFGEIQVIVMKLGDFS